jgi:hypothetical protein
MRLHDYAPRPAHLKWLLDSDPAIRWQVMRNTGEAPNAIAAERSRIATEGWGAQLLARQTPAGNWGAPKKDRGLLSTRCTGQSTPGRGARRCRLELRPPAKAGVLRSTPPSACSKDCSNSNEQGANRRPSPRPVRGPRTICSIATCSARFEPAKSSTNAGSASRSRPLGTTTSCVDVERRFVRNRLRLQRERPFSSSGLTESDSRKCRRAQPWLRAPSRSAAA